MRNIVVGFNDMKISVYKVLTGEYRAYVISNANLQAWGFDREDAIRQLNKRLIKEYDRNQGDIKLKET